VLGLGDIGPEAAMPVMEGKAMLFKEFGGVDAFSLCLATKDVDQIVAFVTARIGPDWTRPGLVMLVSVAASADTAVSRQLPPAALPAADSR
jgi:malic enzyme